MTAPLVRGAAVTPATVLAERAATEPGRIFLTTDDEQLTWHQVHERALAAGAGLAGLGVTAGDTVVVALGNRVEFLETWFGLAGIGAVEVPAAPELVGPRLAHVVRHSGARVAVVEPDLVPRLDELAADLPGLRHVVVVDAGAVASSTRFASARFASTSYAELTRRGRETAPDPQPPYAGRAGDLAAVLYTSGSTGPPKGVCVPHGQHHANGAQAVHVCGITAADVLFLCLPLHHNMAQGYGVWPALLAGCRVRLVRRFDRSTFWRDVRDCGATVWPFVGGLLALLAARPAEDGDAANPLRIAYGVPIPAALHRSFEQRFALRLVHGYGSTEATIPVWTREPAEPGAAGRVIPGYHVRVVNERGTELPTGSVGEIVVRSDSPVGMFLGYHDDPVRTAAVCREGWFHTGDRGRFDDAGLLWFCGRAGDAIRRFGEFVDAEEVEAAALVDPAVLHAGCFAVDDDVAGQEVALAVVPRDGMTVSPPRLRARLAERLPSYAVPRYVEVVASLPTTNTGKVERYQLRNCGLTAGVHDARAREGQIG